MMKLPANDALRHDDVAERRALLSKVHIGAKALGMDDADYRAFLFQCASVHSARDCTNDQLRGVLDEMRRRGFKDVRQCLSARANNPVANKARALWISLYQLAAIDDPSESALESFARRQLGVDRLHWIDQRRGDGLIEALKAMAEREGWDQRLPDRLSQEKRIRLLKERLLDAQQAKVVRLGRPPVSEHAPNYAAWTEADLEHASHIMGQLLRQIVAAQ